LEPTSEEFWLHRSGPRQSRTSKFQNCQALIRHTFTNQLLICFEEEIPHCFVRILIGDFKKLVFVIFIEHSTRSFQNPKNYTCPWTCFIGHIGCNMEPNFEFEWRCFLYENGPRIGYRFGFIFGFRSRIYLYPCISDSAYIITYGHQKCNRFDSIFGPWFGSIFGTCFVFVFLRFSVYQLLFRNDL